MEDKKVDRKFDLTSFKKLNADIAGINDQDWQGKDILGHRRYYGHKYAVNQI